MAIIKLNNNALTSVTALPSGVGADPNVKTDLARLGLRVFANQNLVATNSNSLSYDVFQDDSGIASNTNAPRNASEYVSTISQAVGEFSSDSNTVFLHHMNNSGTDSSSNTADITLHNGAAYSTTEKKFGTHSLYLDGSNDYAITDDLNDVDGSLTAPTTGVFTLEFWYKYVDSSHNGSADRIISLGTRGSNTPNGGSTPFLTAGFNDNNWNTYGNFGSNYNWDNTAWNKSSHYDTNWHHVAYIRNSSGYLVMFTDGYQRQGNNSWSGTNIQQYSDGTIGNVIYGGTPHSGSEYWKGYIDEVRYSNIVRYTPANDGDQIFTPNLVNVTNATGNFISNAITAPSSTSKMGAVITYKDQAGTNALNSDLVLQLSADNGSNFSTATLTALPDFATGVKCCKVSDLSVTAGTQLKYKISFANQSSGSKECRVTGVSLQY